MTKPETTRNLEKQLHQNPARFLSDVFIYGCANKLIRGTNNFGVERNSRNAEQVIVHNSFTMVTKTRHRKANRLDPNPITQILPLCFHFITKNKNVT